MSSGTSVSDILSVAAAAIASLGSAGALIFALSSWLGRVWATRIMEREKSALILSIERAKVELTLSIEREKAAMAKFHEAHRSELQELSTARQDALNRKRDVYTDLATGMRILLKANMTPQQQEADKWAFLAAYDKGYIWASEGVIGTIGDLLKTLQEKAGVDTRLLGALAPEVRARELADSQRLDAQARARYQHCMREMRKDSGFEDSAVEYRVVSF